MALWGYAKEKAEQNAAKKAQKEEAQGPGDDDSQAREESYILLFGGRSSGKTSLILRFLDRDEQTKPTIALEYTYGRRTKGNTKEVGHIWELGGGTSLISLLDSVITAEAIEQLSLVLMLDLSQPDTLWATLETCLNNARTRIQKLIDGNRDLNEKLMKKAWARIGPDCQDKDFIKPFPIPLAIVGGKYDVFQDIDPEKRKLITRTLRFLAHVNGVSLQFFSLKIDSLVTRGRALISHYIFNTAASKGLVTDHTKPLFIPAGADSIQDIGPPPSTESGHISGSTPVDLWKSAFCEHFPQKSLKIDAIEDPAKDPQYKEEAIDLLRAQKDQELEKYIRQRAREDVIKENITD